MLFGMTDENVAGMAAIIGQVSVAKMMGTSPQAVNRRVMRARLREKERGDKLPIGEFIDAHRDAAKAAVHALAPKALKATEEILDQDEDLNARVKAAGMVLDRVVPVEDTRVAVQINLEKATEW